MTFEATIFRNHRYVGILRGQTPGHIMDQFDNFLRIQRRDSGIMRGFTISKPRKVK